MSSPRFECGWGGTWCCCQRKPQVFVGDVKVEAPSLPDSDIARIAEAVANRMGAGDQASMEWNDEIQRLLLQAGSLKGQVAASDRDRNAWKQRAEKAEADAAEVRTQRDAWHKDYYELLERRNALQKERDALKARVAELEADYSDDLKEALRIAGKSPALRWTREAPTVPGWYWVKWPAWGGVERSPRVECLYEITTSPLGEKPTCTDGVLRVSSAWTVEALSLEGVEWAGPLPEPPAEGGE